jgi:molybdate transport system substrate-binding protein
MLLSDIVRIEKFKHSASSRRKNPECRTDAMQLSSTTLAIALTFAMPHIAKAAEIEVISGGAFKQVLNALVQQYQKDSGTTVNVTYRTVGQHMSLLKDGGESFDVAILTPEAIGWLATEGKVVAGNRADLARTGVGVAVKEGAPRPGIGTVEAFKRTLLAAKSVAYIDPKAGGSSGIYVGGLLERLGIADAVNAKAVLIQGGDVASHVVDGEAEIGIHQICEILAVKGAVLVGPLPAEIQNFTVYSAGVSVAAKHSATANEFVNFLTGPHALPIIKAKGMEPVPS